MTSNTIYQKYFDNHGWILDNITYSQLGIKEHVSLLILHEPEDYFVLLGPLPHGVSIHTHGIVFDFIHFFATLQKQLEKIFPFLAKSLKYSGMMRISWPKKSSQIVSDLNENIIRKIGLS